MKRKVGEAREDGWRFKGYRTLPSGTVREDWVSPEAWANRRRLAAKLASARWQRIKTNPDTLAAYNAAQAAVRHEDRRRRPVAAMLARAKIRARERGVPFAITTADVVIPERCPVFGIPLRIADGYADDASPELDRITPALGYVPGNVIVISRRANRIKNDATAAELRALADFLDALT